MSRRIGVVLLVVVALVAVGPKPARAADATVATWIRPVSGAVVRPFDPPVSRFGAGHLGVDLAAPHGTPVRAAGPGVVSFAGRVARSLHVVVAHAGNLRTSYSFLSTITVHRGDTVHAGQVVGTTGARDGIHDGTVLHFALRAGDTYVDPMALFRAIDLPSVVHLAPTSEPPHAVDWRQERGGLLAGLRRDFGSVVHAVGRGAAAAGSGVARAGRAVVKAALKEAAREQPLLAAVVRGTGRYLSQHCDAHAPPANGEGGSGHRLMLVAGIDSSLTGSKNSLGLPTDKLGYTADEVTNFSYAKDGGDYVAADTEGPLVTAARRLADQLRALQRREPGREVDLLAHSQGGVVVEVFLTQIYKSGDPSYPPIGTVVTLSSPLQGDPIATAVAKAERVPADRALLSVAETAQSSVHRVMPPHDAPAVRDLASNSPLMRKLRKSRLPFGIQLTAITASTDWIVPATAATRPGARRATVTPHSFMAHTAILTDRDALQDIRAALEGRPLPCRSLVHEVGGEVVSTSISEIEGGRGQRLLSQP
jgi:hypothetical protein